MIKLLKKKDAILIEKIIKLDIKELMDNRYVLGYSNMQLDNIYFYEYILSNYKLLKIIVPLDSMCMLNNGNIRTNKMKIV